MIDDKLFFDIETLPTVDPALIADISALITPPANMKKPETIAAWEANERPAAILEAVRRTSLDGGTGRLASIAWALADGEVIGAHTAGPDGWSETYERDLIAAFFKEADLFFKSVSGAVLVGHNVLQFDIRWLWKRSIILGVAVPDWWPLHARAWSPDVNDTMLLWEGHGGRISQDRLGRILGLGGKGAIDGSQVAGLWDAGEYDRVLSYNADDVAKVRRMWSRITQFDGPCEPAMEPIFEVVEAPAVERKAAAMFFEDDDEELQEEVVAPAEVAIAEKVDEKPEPAVELPSEDGVSFKDVEVFIERVFAPDPTPATRIVDVKFDGPYVVVDVEFYDGKIEQFAVKLKNGELNPYKFHWRRLSGGIEYMDGKWVRITNNERPKDRFVMVEAPLEEKPKRGRVVPKFLVDRGLAA